MARAGESCELDRVRLLCCWRFVSVELGVDAEDLSCVLLDPSEQHQAPGHGDEVVLQGPEAIFDSSVDPG